jgi:nitrate/nitrite transporter NarK
MFFAGAHLSGGLTPMFVAYLATFLHWRTIFLLLGSVGVFWAVAWFVWFRDEPREHSSVSPEETEMIEASRGLPPGHAGSWRDVLRTKSLVPLCIQYFANTYGFFFFISWLPTYLEKSRGMANVELALFAGLPLLLSVIADITGGFTTDLLSKRFGLWTGRCGVGAVAYLLAAVGMAAGTLVANGRLAGFLIAVGGALSMFTLAPAWATAIHLGGKNSGALSATMNTAGQVGGMLSPVVLAYIVDRWGNWSAPLHILSALYLIAAVSWLLIHPERAEDDTKHLSA